MVGLNEIENNNNNTILDDDNQTQSYDALDLHNPQHQEKHINKYSLRSYSSPANLAVPPPNFSKVSKGIYRSSCPRLQNHEFLKNLGVKSIVYFVPGDYPEENKEFLSSQNINLFHFPTKGNKADRKMPEEVVVNALRCISNPENHPVLVHCRQGKHRTGTVVGCLRKLQNWPLQRILSEYLHFANDKPRIHDQNYIATFDHTKTLD